MNHSTPGLPVHHQLQEFTQTHVQQVGDAIQLSHPLASPSPPAPNPSQHQGLSSESTLCMRWPKYWSCDVLFIIGVWNAKVWSQETPGVTGKFGLGVQNEAGQRLIEFCQENTLVIANTLFQQHKGRLYTWTSPDGQHWNQIDYILCSQRWEKLYTVSKNKTGGSLWLISWTPYCQIQA